MIEEEDVSPPTLMKVFQGAFMEVSDLSESAFKVKGLQFPFKLNVRIEPDHKFISLVDYNFLHRITHADALKLCNEANQKLGPARFFVADYSSGMLQVTHYQLTFERGLLPFHLIAGFRTFEQCVGFAVRGLFKDYIQ